MFEKMKLKSKIKSLQKEIAAVEQKRYRSQSALVEAILTKTTPDDADVDYFNRYTQQIEEMRADIRELETKLNMQ